MPMESRRSLAWSCAEMCFWTEARPEGTLVGGGGVDPVFFGVFGGGVEVVDKAWGVPPGVVPFGGDRGRSEGVGVDLVG